ncbi:uncharacterized protein LOC104862948 isoform X2 [Fukomys damarensis]|uniref:uncharacterized protein LOC104862948 isoform X2 n=1 Tax=Fukomys damarensis TaxID=885580 RepID=UPI00053FDBD9|nr:uncharacterized protein LOC104862948 isoform X2 [Fukomys damarensis]
MGSSVSKAALGATTDEPTEPEARHLAGYSMSIFIRRYSKYLNEKSLAYRFTASDITKTKRGTNGVMRTMNTRELLDTLPVIQTQFDALLKFNANPDELTNGIIHAAFLLLFKDSLRLFAAYNEGILNLLDKYFNMRRSQCKESLDLYIKFLGRTTKLTQFLKVAEQVGIYRSDIPCLTQAHYSLIEALKQHLIYLEKKNDNLPPYSLQHEFIPSIPDGSVMKALASRAASTDRNFGERVANKTDRKWCQPSEMEIRTGRNSQLNTCMCTSTIWNSISGRNMVPTPMDSPSLMASQSTIYTHQCIKTTNLSIQTPGHKDPPPNSKKEEARRKMHPAGHAHGPTSSDQAHILPTSRREPGDPMI